MMDKAAREKARELCEKATPGPWFHRDAFSTDRHNRQLDWLADAADRGQHHKIIIGRGLIYGGADDYAFISAARTLLPQALDALDAADSDNARLQARVSELEAARSIPLTKAEIQSGLNRVKWAEGLITQLPANHDGRNSWLLNYGCGEEADQIRVRVNAERLAHGLALLPAPPVGDR